MLKKLVFAALLVLPSLAIAQSFFFLERYTIPVNQIDATTFETVDADGAGGTQHWCAAGIYASKVLGLKKVFLFIKQPLGPSVTVPGRKGVVFSTEPVPGATQSYSEGVRKAGKTFSLSHASALCWGDYIGDVQIRLANGQLVWR